MIGPFYAGDFFAALLIAEVVAVAILLPVFLWRRFVSRTLL